MRSKLAPAVLAAAAFLAPQLSSAALYSYYIPNPIQLLSNINDTATVPIFLEELLDVGETDADSLLISSNGLIVASFALTSSNNSVFMDSFAAAPAWDALSGYDGSPAEPWPFLFVSPLASSVSADADPIVPGLRRVLLGDFVFKRADLVETSTTFTAAFDGDVGIIANDFRQVLQADSADVTIIPEPATLSLLALGLPLLLRRQRNA